MKKTHSIVIFNDDIHSIDYVVMVIRKVFGYSEKKAASLAYDIHNNGKAVVWSGISELAESKQLLIRNAGPDTFHDTPVESPLNIEIKLS